MADREGPWREPTGDPYLDSLPTERDVDMAICHEHYRKVLDEAARIAAVRDAEIMERLENLEKEISELQTEDAAIRSACTYAIRRLSP